MARTELLYSARPTLRIDLGAVKRNYKTLNDQIGHQTLLSASIKADAYGLGAERVGRTLYGAGCRNFFVATSGEGKILREVIGESSSIFVLNGPAPRDISLFQGFDLKPVINNFEQARLWLAATENAPRRPACAIHIDTGMNRLGFDLTDLERLTRNKRMMEELVPRLLMSHLACAGSPDSRMNKTQLAKFKSMAARFPIIPMSLVNSAGIGLGKNYHFQMVRAGLGLYARDVSENPANNITENTVSLMAPVLQIRKIAAGETIGYDATYKAERDMRVAIVGAGYADGLPRALSAPTGEKGGHAIMQGKRVPVVGRVSMDLTALDISELSTVKLGHWAEFMGEDLLALANAAGTIPYEVLVNLGTRCRREYLK